MHVCVEISPPLTLALTLALTLTLTLTRTLPPCAGYLSWVQHEKKKATS